MIVDTTDYTRSRTLAEFTVHGGEHFRICRKRWDGRYWSMYPTALACVWNGIDVSGDHWTKTKDISPKDAATYYENLILKKFPIKSPKGTPCALVALREDFLKALQEQLDAHTRMK